MEDFLRHLESLSKRNLSRIKENNVSGTTSKDESSGVAFAVFSIDYFEQKWSEQFNCCNFYTNSPLHPPLPEDSTTSLILQGTAFLTSKHSTT